MKHLSHSAAVLCMFASAVLASPFAAAHAALKNSVPAADAIVDAPPTQITLTFNEKVEEAFSSASVKDANGNSVATAKVRADPANPLVLHLDLQLLASGPYQVQWNAVGNDGHRRTGAFKFSVK